MTFLFIFKGDFEKNRDLRQISSPKKITAPLNFGTPKSEKISAPLNFGELKICQKLKKFLAPFKGGAVISISLVEECLGANGQAPMELTTQ